ncbi:MAG: glutamate synthase, partial [Planctomycetota bacterium]
ELDGVHRAMAYLHQSTRSLLDSEFADGKFIDAKDKDVVVIGGGDTGTDCIGTALRQGCRSVVNITRRQREPDYRDEQHPWPGPPGTFYVDYGHAEGQAKFGKDPREFRVLPKAFVPSEDDPTKLGAVRIAMLDWKQDPETGRMTSTEIEGSEKDVPADLCFLSIGFTGADTPELLKNMGIASERGVVPSAYGDFATGVDNVFVAGDMRRGASLIVWAIAEGRGAARRIDAHLMGASSLPAPIEDAAMLSSAD